MNTFIHTVTMPNGTSLRYVTNRCAPWAVIATATDHPLLLKHHEEQHIRHNTSAHALLKAINEASVICEENPRASNADDTHTYRLAGLSAPVLMGGGDGYVHVRIRHETDTRTHTLPALPALLERATALLAEHTRSALRDLALANRPVYDHTVIGFYEDEAAAEQAATHNADTYLRSGQKLSTRRARVDAPEHTALAEIHERLTQARRDTMSTDPCVRARAYELRATAYNDLAEHAESTTGDKITADGLRHAAHGDRTSAALIRYKHAIPTPLPRADLHRLPVHSCASCGRPWQRSPHGKCPQCPRLMYGPTPNTIEQARDYPSGIEIDLGGTLTPIN